MIDVELMKKEAERLARVGMYDPNEERDACGVGVIASIDGTPSRDVVTAGIDALKALFYRGAVDADGKTGDGAGIHIDLPQEFFKEHIRHTGHEPSDKNALAVGMIFLPRTDMAAQERCRAIVETEILREGYSIYGWRQVPVMVEAIGDKANATRPEIEQVMIANTRDQDDTTFERMLYVIRRRIEKRVNEEQIADFYVCSLSCRTIIYKGLFLAGQLTAFFPDLLDERFISRFVVYHQRYSTNTFPTWSLAQPFRMVAHNGEINTITGNENWMKAHETLLSSDLFGEKIEDLKPLIQPGSSDSAALDAVFELLCRGGRTAPLVKSMLIPEATGLDPQMSSKRRAFIEYCSTIIEAWDGPAALAGTDGRWVFGGMDRNGLRPMRYAVTKDGFLVLGSESGMIRIEDERVIKRGRVGPGEMIGIDLEEGRLYENVELKEMLADTAPFEEWTSRITHLHSVQDGDDINRRMDDAALRRRQAVYAQTTEDMDTVLAPMVMDGKEAVGSMGDDVPLAVLSDGYRPLHHFFRQTFSQVTNPPIDSLREMPVMSLQTRLGNNGNILHRGADQCDIVQIDSPVLTSAAFERVRAHQKDKWLEIDCTFPVGEKGQGLMEALERVSLEAERAVQEGRTNIVLTDEGVSETRAPMPMILATGCVHTHLVQKRLRTFTAIHVRSAECLDTHYFAVLIGVGASTVNPYLTLEAIASRHAAGQYDGLPLKEALAHYVKAINHGLLKIMSKMGIGVVSAYRGGYNFEALGLSRALVENLFPGMSSRISGIGLAGIEKRVREQHGKAFTMQDNGLLPVGSFYRHRKSGEPHGYRANLIKVLQKSVETDSYRLYKEYIAGLDDLPPINLRDLLGFKPDREAVPVDDVESITEIRKRFVTPGMSYGALSPEAHGTLNIAMNRIGAKSVSGEGGEDRERYTPYPNGDNANSAIKQVASGRFGVNAEYLNNCVEIEIKMAQGAKPGEGGQLPGFKVTTEIARLRNATPGVTLISPPPHHDIYSIEDLAQLIYDLKQINPTAYVCVKLVARHGIGTIAAGVAKAGADRILISGHNGGTGASPLTSTKFAGVPWELGLAEANQVLTLNRLRHRVRLRADGGIRSGRDIVIAAMLGAEEYGIGTTSLVALGCVMVRQCHSNTCPVGVCTQDPELRKRFKGSPEKVVSLFSFIAAEVREILASLGFKSLDEIVGRADLLTQVSRGWDHLDDLDLNPILACADSIGTNRICTLTERNEVPGTLDEQIIEDARPALEDGEKMQLAYNVRNTHRTVGAKLSHKIVKKYGMTGLRPGHITVRLRGTAGQSLGAFAVQGVKLEVFGDANDYVGKGLSGGTIVVRPKSSSLLPSHENSIIGNTVLYGATAGRVFAAGLAGERFAVRNSGARAVIEGCGVNGCEYMTGGIAVILGEVGANFGAGMTGGMAYIYDPDNLAPQRINPDSIILQRLEVPFYEDGLKALIEEHFEETNSRRAEEILRDWETAKNAFWQVVPKEMLDKLDVATTVAGKAAQSA